MAHQTPWSSRVTVRVKRVIKQSGLSDRKLSELTGIPHSTFRRRKDGVNPWDLKQIEALARVLDTTPELLIQLESKANLS